MVTTFYDNWVADGKPWRPAKPLKQAADKIKAAFPDVPPADIIGMIGDLAHLKANPPQDHTPFSQTGWPVAHPYPVVNALDIMHKPDLGLDCREVFAHWLASAKAGQLPWLKYLIWQAKRYDVRFGWDRDPQPSTGHFDHMHASGRSDTTEMSIGNWHPLPGRGEDSPDGYGLLDGFRVDGDHTRTVPGPDGARYGSLSTSLAVGTMQRAAQDARLAADGVDAIRAQLAAAAAAQETRDRTLHAVVQAIAGGDGMDATSIVAAIRAEGEATRALVERRFQAQVAELSRSHATELAERDAWVAELQAELDRAGTLAPQR